MCAPSAKNRFMKKRVTYEIRGQIERNCFFRVGTALVRMEFTGGSVNSAGVTPAQFVTENPVYQRAIENSADFRSGVIKRGAVHVIEEPDDAKPASEEEKKTLAVYSDVSNIQQARAVLMSEEYGCTLSDLQNKASVRAKADEKGVSFPNWL